MINYVNNSYDNVLKPCDAQKFNTLTTCEHTEKLILAHRVGEPKAKGKLPALTYMGVFDKDKYKRYLKQCEEQGTKPRSPRHAEFMRPTGLLMLDFDHVGASPSPSEGGVTRTTSAIDSPVKLWEYIKSFLTSHPSLGRCDVKASVATAETLVSQRSPAEQVLGGGLKAIALAHITPSGDGLRLVLKRPVGMTIEQAQYEWCQMMNLDSVGIKPDAACKDISRLSFAPMQKEILYYNPSLLFAELPNREDYPDGTIFSGVKEYRSEGVKTNVVSGVKEYRSEGVKTNVVSGVKEYRSEGVQTNVSSADGLSSSLLSEATTPELLSEAKTPKLLNSYDTEYNGVPYSEIVARLEEQLGGRPEHGARNSFIFSMACNLRYICNDDAAWIAAILPTYGEDAQKHRTTIQSAVNRPMSREMPETLKRALGVAKVCADNEQQTADNGLSSVPQMPEVLPQPVALLVSRTPDRMKAAVAMSVFPPLGAHLRGVDFTYWDGRNYEPTFMNVVVAELSSGKSAVNTPIEYILADIEVRDEVALGREREWKDKCARISSTQDKPERPKGLVVQILPSDMTNAAFVQRLADADGYFLYTQMDEIELLNALKTNTAGNNVSAILRLAFDCGKYGQARVAANAINAKVRVRWNWNASSTVQRVRKFFAKNVADGTLSRVSFATIVKTEADRYGRNRPKYLAYGEHFADELHPYIDRLTTCTGTLICPEAQAWAEQLCDELSNFAEEVEDETYAILSFRAVLMGFFRAMVLYVMNGCQWSREIEEFAAWTVRYDLWCKMRFFRDMLHSDLQGEEASKQRGPVGLLSMLPDEFTREDVKVLRIAQGMKPDPRRCLDNWISRGHIEQLEHGRYMKCPQSSVHN